MIEYRKKFKQITFEEYYKATKDMNSLEKAFSPYSRKIKVYDLLHDEHVGIREYIRLMDKRYEEAEKTASDPDDFEYFVEDGMEMVITGSADTIKKLSEVLKKDFNRQFDKLPYNTINYPTPKVNLPNPLKPDPCRNCSNNPLVNKFASGICHCALPTLQNPTIY